MSDVSRYDAWLERGGPAALALREYLVPVEGRDGVLFPATFAASEDRTFKGGYNIDRFPDGRNVCLIDTFGSQANRIEPQFAASPYDELVPQVVIVAGDKRINILEAGHRAGDAIVRCSSLQQELHDAFEAVLDGNAERLAKIAPTSLVFGAWDSRDTQAKLPRLVASTILAFDVRELTRSAQFVPATNYVESDLLEEPPDKKTKDAYAERGFVHVPASGSPGGVIANGCIRRDATLHLAALRMLQAGADAMKTRSLCRYILGLAMTALTFPAVNYLRQGCNLVLDLEKDREFNEVHGDGRRVPLALTHDDATAYARATAHEFGVGMSREVEFDKRLAKEDVSPEDAGHGKGGKKTRAKKG